MNDEAWKEGMPLGHRKVPDSNGRKPLTLVQAQQLEDSTKLASMHPRASPKEEICQNHLRSSLSPLELCFQQTLLWQPPWRLLLRLLLLFSFDAPLFF